MTMIEKAARAVSEHHPNKDWGWGSMHQEEIDYCFAVARAVLLAVREPDIGTTLLGMKSAEVLRSGTVSGSNALFTAMIDAILEAPK